MGPLKPFRPFPAYLSNPLAGPHQPAAPAAPRQRVTLGNFLEHFYHPPKTEWVSGYFAWRHTGDPLRPPSFTWVPGYWRSKP